jgi:hypothetical protein
MRMSAIVMMACVIALMIHPQSSGILYNSAIALPGRVNFTLGHMPSLTCRDLMHSGLHPRACATLARSRGLQYGFSCP